MAYSVLYNEDPNADILALLTHIDAFTKSMGIGPVELNPDACQAVLLGMRQDFPHIDGLEHASAFKKLANFVSFFVALKPLPKPFPAAIIGQELAAISNHQNAIVAFQIAVDSLEGSTILVADGKETKTLKNRIALSKHSYIDIIEAISESTPVSHYKLITVLLEQLAYKTNPECQYEIVGP